MVSVSVETPGQTEARLKQVIRLSEFKVYVEPFAFVEHTEFPNSIDVKSLALVRDDEMWSELRPRQAGDNEAFAIFSFHFPTELDNSGFVGWLASHLKARFGTGLFVVCGQNSARGGIFDYWGCPWELADAVIDELKQLRLIA